MAVEIEGLKTLLRGLDLLTDMDKVEGAINEATLLLERSARQKAPKEIAPTIHSQVKDFEGIVYTNYFTAPYVEYGTGIYAEGKGGGRKEVPWVYVEGQVNENPVKTIHTEDSADQAVAFLREQGLPAVKTYGSKPKPYMRPALDENRDEIVRILGEALVND